MSWIIIVLLVIIILNIYFMYRSGIKPVRDSLKEIAPKLDGIQNL